MRLDVCVFARGLTSSREKAAVLIREDRVTVNGMTVNKPSFDVAENDLVLVTEAMKYVGRGGYKLEGAITAFSLDLQNKTCLDIGSSTGGFTDCMLQNGAAKVFAVDVGSDQLAESLRANPKVVSMEKTDIRSVKPFAVDFIGADLSFISLEIILPVARQFLKSGANAVFLIKPQFEVGRVRLKNGIVKDKKMRLDVLNRVVAYAQSADFNVENIVPSPIRGGDGNVEFLMLLTAGYTKPFRTDLKSMNERV